ncbi:hypothetical protein KKA14_21685 [bacterium]|nr:hypothetical protein [bacterium]
MKEALYFNMSTTSRYFLVLGGLPLHHKDPFDRMLIAQSMINKLALMSDDSKFLPYDCKII